MLDSLFAFLFKYRPVVFENGELAFRAPWPAWGTVLLVAGGGALAAVSYLRLRGRLRGRDRVVLAALRFAALVVLVFCLARPVLVVAVVVPQQSFLGILVDDSRSMQIVDGERSRARAAAELLAPDGPLVRALADRFKLRWFGFAEAAERVEAVGQLSFTGRRTDLAGALDAARSELGSLPLAGLVLVSDGAENGAGSLAEALLALKAEGVPVHVVGMGRERFERDVEVARVAVARRVLQGSAVAADVTIAHAGLTGETVPVHVEAGGRIVGTGEVRLPRDGEAATGRVHFTASGRGPRLLRFSVPARPGERLVENNTLAALVEVEDRRERILYVEGEPRSELKFLRRAVADDENLQVVVLLRTADEKFLRLDVSDSTELAAGFPRTRQELYRYRGIILGSVEASFFAPDQLRMMADFVARRGGGLLALGGRHGLAEGGYAGTPLVDALPVLLERDATTSAGFFAEVEVTRTPAGRGHPVTRLAAGEVGADGGADSLWSRLPPVSVVNPVTEVKPGATVLLSGRAAGDVPYVVLATQRYGRGRAAALTAQDTWLWQMGADVPPDDPTHERFWQQLLRWLVSEVPDPVSASVAADQVEAGTPVALTVQVADSAYLGVNGARVVATVVSPSGQEQELPLEWTVERDGEYRASFAPSEEGLHEIRVEARRAGELLGTATTHLDAGDVGAEVRNAAMRAPLLRRIAEETGGRFYTPGTAASLPEDVSFTESGATVREERSLWDMPALFLLLLGFVAGEWAYRRRRGLP